MPQSKKKPSNAQAAGIVAAAAVVGSFLSRWHGGGFISGSPKILKAFLWSAPFALVAFMFWYGSDAPTDIMQWWDARHGMECSSWDVNFCEPAFWLWLIPMIVSTLALLLCMAGKNTGHGGGMDLAHNEKEPDGNPKRDPEKVEYLILWIRKAFHVKHSAWYDAAILLLVGLAAVLGASLAVGYINLPAGAIIAVGGALKPAAYAIGWWLHDKGLLTNLPEDLDHATAVGEFLTGMAAFLFLSIAFLWGLWHGLLAFPGIF